MKVILLSDLRHRGRRGQVVEVKHEKKKIEARHGAERAAAAAMAARIADVRLTLKKRAQDTGALYGSVTATEIVEAMKKTGVEVDRRQIDLAGGVKTVGEHIVRIDLHSEVVAELMLTVEAEE